MAQIVNVSSILSKSILSGFSGGSEASMLPRWLDTANSMLCVLLKSIDLMFLKLTRWA